MLQDIMSSPFVNPFDMIPVEMFEKIFSQLDIKNIAKCREVCQSWKNVATPLLKNKLKDFELVFEPLRELFEESVINDEDSSNLDEDWKEWGSKSAEFSRLPKYIEYLESGGDISFPRIKLKNISPNDIHFQRFLIEYGHTVKWLNIMKKNNLKGPISILKESLLEHCPNLKSFKSSSNTKHCNECKSKNNRKRKRPPFSDIIINVSQTTRVIKVSKMLKFL